MSGKFRCPKSGHTDLQVGGPLQQTDAAGMNSDVLSGLTATLDGSVCLQLLVLRLDV